MLSLKNYVLHGFSDFFHLTIEFSKKEAPEIQYFQDFSLYFFINLDMVSVHNEVAKQLPNDLLCKSFFHKLGHDFCPYELFEESYFFTNAG